MKNLLLLTFFFACNYTFSQKASLGQYYSFCEIMAEVSENDERILEVNRIQNKWVIKAQIIDNCLVRLYPNHAVVGDTLKIEMLEITEYAIGLENGDEFVEELPAYDCSCLYEVRMEFNLDQINHLSINNKLERKNAFMEK